MRDMPGYGTRGLTGTRPPKRGKTLPHYRARVCGKSILMRHTEKRVATDRQTRCRATEGTVSNASFCWRAIERRLASNRTLSPPCEGGQYCSARVRSRCRLYIIRKNLSEIMRIRLALSLHLAHLIPRPRNELTYVVSVICAMPRKASPRLPTEISRASSTSGFSSRFWNDSRSVAPSATAPVIVFSISTSTAP